MEGKTFIRLMKQNDTQIHSNKLRSKSTINHHTIKINHNNFLTLANALNREALTPGVLAIFWPTAAKMLQFGITAT